MDLLYGNWNTRQRAWVDAFTVLFLFIFLVFLLYGGINSTIYSLTFSERSYSAWQPYMWPVKFVMVFGIVMMLLRSIAEFFRDILMLRQGSAPTPPRHGLQRKAGR
jgi:TRAP-type mannitol/chloroaromatic compound transport system permease small subunit